MTVVSGSVSLDVTPLLNHMKADKPSLYYRHLSCKSDNSGSSEQPGTPTRAKARVCQELHHLYPFTLFRSLSRMEPGLLLTLHFIFNQVHTILGSLWGVWASRVWLLITILQTLRKYHCVNHDDLLSAHLLHTHHTVSFSLHLKAPNKTRQAPHNQCQNVYKTAIIYTKTALKS